MLSVLRDLFAARRAGLVSACAALVVATQLVGASKSPMKVLKYDPKAEKQELFAGLESGTLAVRVAAHDIKGGNFFIENLSGKPLTVEMPDALALIHVLKQAGNGNGFFGQLQSSGSGVSGSSFGQQGGQQGGGQSMGAGFGQQGNSGLTGGSGIGQQNQIGQGIFSIPADRTVQLPYLSVCLDYGKPDPSPRMSYRPVPLDEYTQDPVLQETLRMFGRGRIDQTSAQAAMWHQTDNMSWKELASLKEYTLPGVYSSQVPTFSFAQLQAAHELVSQATKKAAVLPKSQAPTRITNTVRRNRTELSAPRSK